MRAIAIGMLAAALVVLAAGVCWAAPKEAGGPFTDVKPLNVAPDLPACLSNDGKRVLYLQASAANSTSQPASAPATATAGKNTYWYSIVNADGTGTRTVLDTGTTQLNQLGFASTNCLFSGDSKQFLALQVKGSGNDVTIDTAVCDLNGKTKVLARNRAWACGGCFAPDGTIYFVDNTSPARSGEEMSADLNRYDPASGTYQTLLTVDGVLLGLTISPDGKRLAAVELTKQRLRAAPLWAYDILSGRAQVSPLVRVDDVFGDEWVRLVWSDDSQTVYVAGRPLASQDPAAPLEYGEPSILAFRPFPEEVKVTGEDWVRIDTLIKQLGGADLRTREAAQAELIKIGEKARKQVADAASFSDDPDATVRLKVILAKLPKSGMRLLQQGKQLTVLAGFGDGRLSVTDANRSNGMKGQAYVLDPAADKLTPLPRPLVLIDRKAGTALLLDLTTGKYATAKMASGK